MPDLQNLNSRQKEAVMAPLGPVLVLAGPGSGKTKTLTSRIAYIIENKLVHPSNILALTFTNKAAGEMRERLKKLLSRYSIGGTGKKHGSLSDMLTMGTFHSVCARMLRQEISFLGYGRDFVIFDSEDQKRLLREILEDLRLDSKKFPPSMFSAYISSAKNWLKTPEELVLDVDRRFLDKVRAVYKEYQDRLMRQNALDFDDLLMLMVKILENSPKILEKYQKQFSYILVDEYQDTNQAQYILLKLLAVHHRIFVVGDDAQSIYGFRGSNIQNILNFEKDFPECSIIKLEQNYRSTQNILKTAQKVIELNSEQKEKTLWTENQAGEKVKIIKSEDEREEALFVAKKIISLSMGQKTEPEYEKLEDEQNFSILDRVLRSRKFRGIGRDNFRQAPVLPKNHASLKEFCVLYRTHAQSRALEEVFIEAAIPYQIVGGLKFYERKEIKDMLAYLRLVLNFRDLVSLKRVINEPPRGIGDKSYQVVRDFILNLTAQKKSDDLSVFRVKLSEIKLPPKQWQSVQDFFRDLESLCVLEENTPLPKLMRAVSKKMGYEDFLRDGTEGGEARLENIKELETVAAKFSSKPWREGLVMFLEEVALLSEIDQKDEEKNGVIMMTLHSAKGLEFDTVFFVGLEEGILPHSRSLIEPEGISEEVRLAYVGLTRARKHLFCVYAGRRRIFGSDQTNRPSRILRALPLENVEMNMPAKHDLLLSEDAPELVVEEINF